MFAHLRHQVNDNNNAYAHHLLLVIDSSIQQWVRALRWTRENADDISNTMDETEPFGGMLGKGGEIPDWMRCYSSAGIGRRFTGICKVWRKRMEERGFFAGEKLKVAVLAKCVILPCINCEPERGEGWTCWGLSMGDKIDKIVPQEWYAKDGSRFRVCHLDGEDEMRCSCGCSTPVDVEKENGRMIFLSPFADLSSGTNPDRSNKYELKVEWHTGPIWAPSGEDCYFHAWVEDDCSGSGARLVDVSDLQRNVCRKIFADDRFNRLVFLPLVVHNVTWLTKNSRASFDNVTGEFLDNVTGQVLDRDTEKVELEFGPLKCSNLEGPLYTICHFDAQQSTELMVAKARLRDTMHAMLSWHNLFAPRQVSDEDKVHYVLDYSEFGHGDNALTRRFWRDFASAVFDALTQIEELKQTSDFK